MSISPIHLPRIGTFTSAVPTSRAVAKAYRKFSPAVGTAIGCVVLMLVGFDSVVNNWVINDFCGNGLQFRTPVALATSANDLPTSYSFAKGWNISQLSNIGHWMTDYAIQKLSTIDPNVFIISGGTYVVTGADMNLCGSFSGKYTLKDLTEPVKLATATDAITYLRGNSLTHFVTDDLAVGLPTTDSLSMELEALGFVAARIQADIKMTIAFPVQNTSVPQSAIVQFYRLYTKSYCTGCPPLAELGRGECNFTMHFSPASNALAVNSTFVLNSKHDVGLMFARDIYSAVSSALKFIALLLALGGYLASRKTVQWSEVNAEKVQTIWHKLIQIVAPHYFPHLSHAVRFDIFCYNSDYFVLLYAVSILLDMNHAIVFTREVNVFNRHSPRLGMTLQLFALSTRLLWLNIGFLKLCKLGINLITPASFSGQSRVIPFFNFSSVTTLYLTTILLFFVPNYIEYNNQSRWDIHNHVELLDGQFVDFFESFYVRVVGAVFLGLIGNVWGVLALDHVVLAGIWRVLKANSLTRQAIYNSTSILCEYVDDVQMIEGDAVMTCRARRLSTLQWYFMHHMVCFGLPEKDMTKRKQNLPTTTASDPPEGREIKYTVGQDSTGHFHLYDDVLADVKSLPFNIKILRNTPIMIK
ncbi:hypothetical protein DYB25_009080 [Aphanomyces astaci]|uniref:Uncharacterized protein n=1 Tax=Aphanomyces astaci TaxID=112090 RepID=A0A397AN82_APHAT|nr:hypothetical protein DYB25_009080 [Aphanomyces astaci]RHY60505.1 hypothetical protein DYB34_005096 [Aphanomyces astaci]